MLHAAREAGNVSTAATCLLAFAGIEYPTPEQTTGAQLLAFGLADLHLVARAHTKDG